MGDLVSAGVEFAVGNLLIFTNSSYTVGRSLCLFFKELVSALIELVICFGAVEFY